ncbi:uncharacterized protein N7496_002460 [Penicillium cataractarum]|uniref:Uncharacterized protein n=1 Tax=Penicillium cataractarum TaxID=2100454 RepID=A0A9W9SKB0_9EURO|nr:uncharacterized protein N7496_002460 [Penicillium cataractarum]KAJ5380032.1 hypothetical protein N7496_002460 [Penicillium cataractarum]
MVAGSVADALQSAERSWSIRPRISRVWILSSEPPHPPSAFRSDARESWDSTGHLQKLTALLNGIA